MPQNCTIYLVTSPELIREAAAYSLPLAHLAYRIGKGGHLFRSQCRTALRGGLMMVDHRDFDGCGTPETLCREIVQECAARSFSGVFWDMEGAIHPILRKSAENLSILLRRRNGWLYLPECCGCPIPPAAKVVIPATVSGGSLKQKLSQSIEKYGAGRIALGLDRVAVDFILPAVHSSGTQLSPESLKKLISERSPAIFFSDELCAHYFTYMRPGESAHFILFDDAASVAKKIQLGASLGIREMFLPFPQNHDLLKTLSV